MQAYPLRLGSSTNEPRTDEGSVRTFAQLTTLIAEWLPVATRAELQVIAYVSLHADNTAHTFARSINRMAADLKLHVVTVRRALAAWVDRRVLERFEGRWANAISTFLIGFAHRQRRLTPSAPSTPASTHRHLVNRPAATPGAGASPPRAPAHTLSTPPSQDSRNTHPARPYPQGRPPEVVSQRGAYVSGRAPSAPPNPPFVSRTGHFVPPARPSIPPAAPPAPPPRPNVTEADRAAIMAHPAVKALEGRPTVTIDELRRAVIDARLDLKATALTGAGVDALIAERLSRKHQSDRIRTVVAYCQRMKYGPGAIVRALTGGWKIAP